MELLQLKYFCYSAETQNFSKTAKFFCVPASNISQSVKRLERELDIELFSRSANRISLNENGVMFYKKVKHALDFIDEATQNIKKKSETKTLRLCILINRRIVMHVIEQFQEKHTDYNFITTHTMPQNLLEYDIIITDRDFDCPYQKTLAAEEKILLAYNKKAFSLCDLSNENELKAFPFITMNNSSSIFENTQLICDKLGFTPHIVLQSEDPFYIRKCIELGLGISFVPELSWQGLFSDDISLKQIGDYKRKIYIYQKYNLSKAMTTFCNMLIENFHVKQENEYIASS